MSADLLREAAAKMRERAIAAALTGVWRGDASDQTTADSGSFTHHVATFAKPSVAVAVANWLDGCATCLDRNERADDEEAAIAVANAYLGT